MPYRTKVRVRCLVCEQREGWRFDAHGVVFLQSAQQHGGVFYGRPRSTTAQPLSLSVSLSRGRLRLEKSATSQHTLTHTPSPSQEQKVLSHTNSAGADSGEKRSWVRIHSSRRQSGGCQLVCTAETLERYLRTSTSDTFLLLPPVYTYTYVRTFC